MSPLPASKQIPDILRTERWLEDFPQPQRGAVIAFAGYPAPYRIGMSNLGFHFLLQRLRSSTVLRTERFFSDTAPRTLESGAPISSAALIFVSISYEEDYLNLARILLQANVPPQRSVRSGEPLIIAGGPAPSANPFPLADIVDCCVLGEGEEPLGGIIGIIERNPRAEPDALLREFAGLPAVFIPAVSVRRTVLAHHTGAPASVPYSVVVTPKAVFPDTLLVEVGRGCPGTCSFCLASALYRPYRAVPVEVLAHLIARIGDLPLAVGLVSTAIAAHPDFHEMVRMCIEGGMRVSLSSIRAEDLDDIKANLIGRAGIKSVSFAPESGSEALRFRLGKHVTNETYIRHARTLHGAGVRNFKLYRLVGCPGEGDETERETRAFLREFSGVVGGRGVSVNANVVIPKAWTPMQFYAMPPERELAAKLKRTGRMCRELGIAVRTKSVRSALRQAVLSLGDARVGSAVLRYAAGGISWKRALAKAGIDPAIPHVARGIGEPLPWDAIEGPVHREFLERRYRQLIEPHGADEAGG